MQRIKELEKSAANEKVLQMKYQASKEIIAKYERERRESLAPPRTRQPVARKSSEDSDADKFVFKPPSHTPGRAKPGKNILLTFFSHHV